MADFLSARNWCPIRLIQYRRFSIHEHYFFPISCDGASTWWRNGVLIFITPLFQFKPERAAACGVFEQPESRITPIMEHIEQTYPGVYCIPAQRRLTHSDGTQVKPHWVRHQSRRRKPSTFWRGGREALHSWRIGEQSWKSGKLKPFAQLGRYLWKTVQIPNQKRKRKAPEAKMRGNLVGARYDARSAVVRLSGQAQERMMEKHLALRQHPDSGCFWLQAFFPKDDSCIAVAGGQYAYTAVVKPVRGEIGNGVGWRPGQKLKDGMEVSLLKPVQAKAIVIRANSPWRFAPSSPTPLLQKYACLHAQYLDVPATHVA